MRKKHDVQRRSRASIRDRLAEFQAGLRKRYTRRADPRRSCAPARSAWASRRRCASSSADPETTVHPQTVIEHFGTWNAAKRRAGLVPRRFATREELLALLRELGDELGRTPTAKDLEARRGSHAVQAPLLAHVRLAQQRPARGRLRRRRRRGAPGAGDRPGRASGHPIGRLPKFADWAEARKTDIGMLTEWQVYRMFDARRGAWSTFQFLIRERLASAGRRGRRRRHARILIDRQIFRMLH